MGRFMDWMRGEPGIPRNEAEPEPQAAGEGQGGEAPSFVRVGAAAEALLGGPAGYGALMSVDYAACEQTKARSLASLPASVVRRKGGDRELVDHPVSALFNGMANEEMSGAELRAWMRLRCDTFGNAYWRVEWWRDQIVAIWPVLCSVRHDFDRSRPAGRRTVYELGGDDYNPAGRYFADEIVNIKTHITKDGVKGVSLARLAAAEIGLSIDLERFYSSMLKNGNHHLGHVEIPEKKVPPAAMADLRAAIDSKTGVGNAGKTPIFAYGATWKSDQQTMRDASVIEQQEWVLQHVCRACNVPPWKVYYQQSTSYAGSQQANIDYAVDTILPDAVMIERAFSPVFAARGEGDLSLKLDLRGLMRGDDASRSQYYREMLYAGAYTRADVRHLEDMDPIPGLEKPLMPLNYGVVEEDGSVTVFGAGGSEPGDGSQTGVTDH